MKIIISSQGCSKDAKVDGRFGRCAYFALYDDEKDHLSFYENKGTDASHGAGIAAAQRVLDLNADVLLTERLGPKAFKVLSESHIDLLKCEATSLEEALNQYHAYEKIESAYK